jgi:hypothetical protein
MDGNARHHVTCHKCDNHDGYACMSQSQKPGKGFAVQDISMSHITLHVKRNVLARDALKLVHLAQW